MHKHIYIYIYILFYFISLLVDCELLNNYPKRYINYEPRKENRNIYITKKYAEFKYDM